MKKKLLKINLSVFKYLLFTPLLLLTYCQGNNDTISLDSQKLLTKDAKVISLMKDAVKSDLQKTLSKSQDTDVVDNQCTHFLYPMTFEVYSGDDPNPQMIEINSDDELIQFIDTLNTSNQFYIFFPITLLDGDGVETIINDLVELEGTLQMAVDACAGFNDDDSNGDVDEDDDSDHSSDNGSDDGSDDEADDDSSHSSDNGSDDSSDDEADDDSNHSPDNGSDDNSDDEADDDSSHSSDNGSDDSSDDEADDDSSHSSDNGSDDSSDDEADDDSSHSSDGNHDEYEYCQDNNKKVYICHNGITICVSVNAIWGHMTHHEDDYLGSCEE